MCSPSLDTAHIYSRPDTTSAKDRGGVFSSTSRAPPAWPPLAPPRDCTHALRPPPVQPPARPNSISSATPAHEPLPTGAGVSAGCLATAERLSPDFLSRASFECVLPSRDHVSAARVSSTTPHVEPPYGRAMYIASAGLPLPLPPFLPLAG